MPAHNPNLKRERESEKELLKCSTFPESPFAKEYFHCQYNLMAFPAQGIVYCKFMQHVEFFTWKPVHPDCGAQKPQNRTQEQQSDHQSGLIAARTQSGAACWKCRVFRVGANHNSCFPLSFERHKSHKASQEEFSLKALQGHLYLLPHFYVLVRSEMNPRVQVWIPVQ